MDRIQLGVWHDGADAIHHALDLADVRLLGFDPQQVGAVLQAGDAVEHAAVFAGAGAELEQVARQALGTQQLAAAIDENVAVLGGGRRYFFAVQEAVVLIAEIADLAGVGDLLGQASAQGVGARDDDAVIDAQLHERITHGANLGEKVFVRHGDLAVLVTALLFVGHLVFDLDAASTRFDHFLGQQVSRFGVTKTGIDVGDDRHHVCLEIVDAVQQVFFLGRILGATRRIEIAEQAAELARIRLTQEGVQLFDQRGHRGLLMHGLIGQRTKLGAQRSDHPAGEIQIAMLGRAVMLLDGDQLLLTDEAMPAAQRLRVLA